MALGPVVLSMFRLFLLAGLVAVLLAARVIERRLDRSLAAPIWWSLLGGLAAARVVYVLSHLPDFRAAPWEALFFWQAGYAPLAGVVAAAGVAAAFIWRGRYPASAVAGPLALGLIVWGGASGLQQALRASIEEPLPPIELADLDDAPVLLDRYIGQPVVLNLWATWCPPCRREMPTLQAAQQETPDVHFLFVNQGEGPLTIRRYLNEEGLLLGNVLLDTRNQVGHHFHSPGLPTTLFFNSDGRLIDTHIGELSRARLGDYVRRIRLGASG